MKRVVDAEAAWGLWHDGWALLGDEQGASVFPMWPAREYAEACRIGDWAEYEIEAIELARLLGELLPQLRVDGVLPGVFPSVADHEQPVRG